MKYFPLLLLLGILLISRSEKVHEQRPQLVVQTGVSNRIRTFSFSGNAQFSATATGSTVIIAEATSGLEIRRLSSRDFFDQVTLNSDGSKMLALENQAVRPKLRLWDTVKGSAPIVFGPDELVSYTEAIAFSPNDEIVATGGGSRAGGYVNLWNARTGEFIKSLPERYQVSAIAFSNDSTLIASASASGVQVREVLRGNRVDGIALEEPLAGTIRSVNFNKNNTQVAAGGDDTRVRVWNVSDGKLLHTLRTSTYAGPEEEEFEEVARGLKNIAIRVLFHPNKNILASGGTDNKLRIWDLDKRELISEETFSSRTPYQNDIVSLRFTPDGAKLLGADWDALIKSYDMATGRITEIKPVNADHVNTVQFSDDGQLLLIGSDDYRVNVWDLRTGQMVTSFEAPEFPAQQIVYEHDRKDRMSAAFVRGTDTVIAEYYKRLVLFEASSSKQIEEFTQNYVDGRDFITGISSTYIGINGSPDGKRQVFLDNNGIHVQPPPGSSGPARVIPDHPLNENAISFVRGSKFLAVANRENLINVWDVDSARKHLILKVKNPPVRQLMVSKNNDLIGAWGNNNEFERWELRAGKELPPLIKAEKKSVDRGTGEWFFKNDVNSVTLCERHGDGISTDVLRLFSFATGDWIAMSLQKNSFDTNNLDNVRSLHWVFPDDPLKALPIEIFMRPYYEPRLIPRLLARDDFKEVPSLEDLNRVQPRVQIVEVKKEAGGAATVIVEAENVQRPNPRGVNQVIESGLKDLRLFRDGQLVGYRDGELLNQQQRANTCERIEGSSKKCRAVFQHIRLPQQDGVKDVEFSAYAFNASDVKSETARYQFSYTRELPAKKGRVYLITVGVSNYENPAWNLDFAANDAHLVDDTVTAKLRATGDYDEVVNVMLTAEEKVVNGQKLLVKSATKQNFRKIMRLLAGERLNTAETKEIPNAQKIEEATPEDVVLIFYSSHGYKDQDRFYLFPYDTGAGVGIDPVSVAPHAISSDDLYQWLRDIDAGDLVLVIDACHAAAVTGREFKPGPMGSRGMGQLAYDKGMRILAATQPDTTAAEVENLNEKRKIQHGLLTYALVADGLIDRRADVNGDKLILMAEWLEYGVADVPKLFEEASKNQGTAMGAVARSQSRGTKRVRFISKGDGDLSIQQPTLFDFTKKVRSKRQLLVERLLRQ